MSRTRVAALIVAAAGALSGCAVPQAIPTADYGPYPADYKEMIQSYHDVHLKDPDSAQLRYLSAPQKAAMGVSWNASYAYLVCLTVNAKNSYGGYTGGRLTAVYMRNGRVVSYRTADHSSGGEDLSVSKVCDTVIGRFDVPEEAK